MPNCAERILKAKKLNDFPLKFTNDSQMPVNPRREGKFMKHILLIILLSLVGLTVAVGQGVQKEPKIKSLLLPGTPAGRQLSEWVGVFNTGDAETEQRFAVNHYAEAALKEHPIEERVTRNAGLFKRTQGLDMRRIEKSEDYAIVVLAQEKLDESWVRINLEVEKEMPYRIANYGIRRIPRPEDLASLPKMTQTETLRDIKIYLDRMTAADQFSGAILIAKNGRPIFEKAYGLASKAFNVPNRVDTKFNLASINKMFTAVAIAQLAEQGKLSFDAPVIKYLPDYPNKTVAEKVTIHQLLTHTSGLGDYFNEKFESKKAALRTVQDYFSLFVDDPLRFEPGMKWRYSNDGFIVLGAIIEKISGESYFDYVKEHIFKPAGMNNTDFYETDRDVPNRAVGYTEIGPDNRAQPGPLRNNLVINPVKGGPAGGGYSTTEDLLKFDIALRGHKLLSEKFTNLIIEGKVAATDGTTNDKYAYGFMTTLANGSRVVGHGGTAPGANCKLDMYLDLGYTVVVLSNYDPRGAERVADRFRERITRR